MSPREERERLWDIVEACERILRHDQAVERLDLDGELAELYKDAVHYNLIVIGEAIGSLSDATRTIDPDIPWRAIVGLRNRLSHEYFRIDARVIQEVVRLDLPRLLDQVRRVIDSLEEA